MTKHPSQGSESYTPGYTTNAVQFMAHRTVAEHGAFFLPYLKPGQSLLDCGCGPGVITAGLAGVVAPGMVTGVDQEITQTEETAGRGINNLQFKQGDIYALPFEDDAFDRVFSNALMEHLADPLKALAEIRRVLKPGGLAGVCSPDWGGFIIAPTAPLLEKAIAFYKVLQSKNGGDPYVGHQLGDLMAQAGFTAIEMAARYECYASRIRIAEYLAQRLELVAASDYEGSTEAELKQMAQALRDWSRQPFGLFAQTWVSAVGRA